jgi:O-antigen ligase
MGVVGSSPLPRWTWLLLVGAGLVVFTLAVLLDVAVWVAVAICAAGLIALVLRSPVLGLCLGIAVMPLEAAGRLIPGNSEITYAKVFLLATVVLVIVRSLVVPHRWRAPRMMWALVLFWVFGLAASFLWPLSPVSENISALVALAGQLVLVVLLYNYVTAERHVVAVVAAIILSTIPVVIFGILDAVYKRSFLGTAHLFYASPFDDVRRVASTFYDPNALGRFLVFAFLVTLGALSAPAFRRFALSLVALMAVQVYVLLNTYSRGSLIALAVALVVYFVWAAPAKVRIISALLIVVMLVGTAWLWPSVFGIVGERFQGAFEGNDPLGGRAELIQQGVHAVYDSPLIGYGPGNTAEAVGRYRGADKSPHNLYIDFLLSAGILGAACVALYAGIHLRAAVMSKEWYARLLVVSFVGLLVMGLSLHGVKTNELWVTMALLAPVARLAQASRQSNVLVREAA